MTLRHSPRFALAIAVAATLSFAAVAAGATRPVMVVVTPDLKVLKVDPDTGDPVKHDPYVQFALKVAVPGRYYRIVIEESPARKTVPCNPGLNTQWYRAPAGGVVAFPLEPVASGKYLPFAGAEPCRGSYVMNVHERRAGSSGWTTVRRFAFSYPSFKLSYLALHP